MFGRKCIKASGAILKNSRSPSKIKSFLYHQHIQTLTSRTSSHPRPPPKLETTKLSNPRSIHTRSQLQPQTIQMAITGPVVEMLARNRFVWFSRASSRSDVLTPHSKFAETYQAPPPLMNMAEQLRATKQGVVVISCSDPRLNPYQVLGIDATLSKSPLWFSGKRQNRKEYSMGLDNRANKSRGYHGSQCWRQSVWRDPNIGCPSDNWKPRNDCCHASHW